MELNSFKFSANSDILKNVTLQMITIENRHAFNGSIIPAVDFFEIYVSGILKMRRRNGPNLSLFNVTVDGCDLLNKSFKKSLSMINFVIKTLRDSLKNLPEKCPWKKVCIYIFFKIFYNIVFLLGF